MKRLNRSCDADYAGQHHSHQKANGSGHVKHPQDFVGFDNRTTLIVIHNTDPTQTRKASKAATYSTTPSTELTPTVDSSVTRRPMPAAESVSKLLSSSARVLNHAFTTAE